MIVTDFIFFLGITGINLIDSEGFLIILLYTFFQRAIQTIRVDFEEYI